MRRIEFPVEHKPDIDPMLSHGWKIASDLPIAICESQPTNLDISRLPRARIR
jgi:hypothetical protein